MPTVIRREARTCPICSLPITVVLTDEGLTFEYDVGEWTRLCRHRDAGSPLTCPAAQPIVRAPLGTT